MPALATEFLQRLGYVIFEDNGLGRFALLSDPPPWFQEIWGEAVAGDLVALADRSPYLEAFLTEAEAHWDSGAETPIDSGSWIERGSSKREFPLEARAWRLDGRRILSIQSAQKEFQEQVRVLQTARDSLLVHERLLKEIQSKEILLHCIIHDLSQPLTAMRGCFDILAQESSAPHSKRLIELGRQQSERQDTMIREILRAFAADITSSMDASSSPQSVPSILACAEETANAFGPIFQSHGAEINIDPRVDRHASWGVAAEKSRLMRVFSNLVENALRHAPKGSAVTIGLKDDGTHVLASVNDEGPGLPKDFRPSEAFALFSKGKQGGGKAGLGLYFCRITVERWGGSIGCESLPGRGARFWFRLPRAAGAESSPVSSHAAPQVHSPSHGPLKILLAEDDPAIRELTGVMLERERHEVVAVESGSKALRALAKRPFDLILLDEEMPDTGGVGATKEIRSRESDGSSHQVIFALTGNSTEEDVARLLAAGFDACLAKPFRAEDLREAIARFFPAAASVADGRKGKKQAAGTSGGASPDPSLLARVGGDRKLLRSIIKTFLADYPAKLRKVKQAVKREDAPALASSAHSIKGAVAIFGAADAVESASELEKMGRQNSLAGSLSVFETLDKAIARLDAKLREYGPPAKRNRARAKRGPHRSR